MGSSFVAIQQGVSLVCAVAWMVVAVYAYLRIRSRPTLLLAIHGCFLAVWRVLWPSFTRGGIRHLFDAVGLGSEMTMLVVTANMIITTGLLIAAVLLMLPGRDRAVLPADSQTIT
jgi:hypothetical protein